MKAIGLLVLAVIFSVDAIEVKEMDPTDGPMLKNDGVFPFLPNFYPLGKRAGYGITWGFKEADSDKYKREGLIPFPRVGRDYSKKSNGQSNGKAMALWFGPRLGKKKRVEQNEFESGTPKYGKERLTEDAFDNNPEAIPDIYAVIRALAMSAYPTERKLPENRSINY